MKNILILSILILAGLNIYSQTPTMIDVHGVSNPQVLQNLGVQITPYGFTDYQIKNAIQNYDTTTISEWNSFILTSTHTPGIMYDFYAVAVSNCFEFVCYGDAFQF